MRLLDHRALVAATRLRARVGPGPVVTSRSSASLHASPGARGRGGADRAEARTAPGGKSAAAAGGAAAGAGVAAAGPLHDVAADVAQHRLVLTHDRQRVTQPAHRVNDEPVAASIDRSIMSGTSMSSSSRNVIHSPRADRSPRFRAADTPPARSRRS